MQLSTNFSLEEMVLSQYAVRNGLANDPSAEAIGNLRLLCLHALEPLRAAIGHPVIISSGYRSPEVNKGIGGVDTSQHCFGQAADITVPGMTVEEVFQFAAKNISFDQLIQEFGAWTHISYRVPCRAQTLRATIEDGKTMYRPAFLIV